MSYQITGKLELVGDIVARSSKNGGQPFYRREFVLDCTRYNPETGEPWGNHPKFELSGNNCKLIEQFKIGQRLTVDFYLKGAKYPDSETGETRYFTSVNVTAIVSAEKPQPEQQPEQAQYQSPTAPTYQQPAPQPFPPKVDDNGVPVKSDDLPF